MYRSMLIGSLVMCLFASFIHADQPVTKEKAAELFATFKRQEGLWRGRSTKGWENRETVKLMALGSVVMMTSEFVDSPGEGMITVFYMDGDRLLLTHYCEAGNQPTLQASIEKPNGDVIFEFVGGTNLPDRNVGHMDKVVFHFVDDDHYTSHWTWFAKGREGWLEKIEYERLQ